MRVTLIFDGLKSINKAFDRMQKEIDKPMLQALAEGALIIHGEAVKSIQMKDGVKKTVGGKTIIVSKPGDPPNTQTGRLVSSIRWRLDKSKLISSVFSKLDYASFLEYGTSKMLARPWLRPAFLKHQDEISKRFHQKMRQAIKRLSK